MDFLLFCRVEVFGFFLLGVEDLQGRRIVFGLKRLSFAFLFVLFGVCLRFIDGSNEISFS